MFDCIEMMLMNIKIANKTRKIMDNNKEKYGKSLLSLIACSLEQVAFCDIAHAKLFTYVKVLCYI